MKRIWFALVGMIAALALLVGLAPAANATEPSSGTEIITSESTSSSETAAHAESVNGVHISSDTKVVAYIQADGATKKQMRAKKVRLPRAMKLWTSYRNTAGQEVWHWKYYPKGKLLVWGKDGWYHDPLCFNKVKYKTPKKVPPSRKLYGKIKVVKKFVFTAKSTSKVKGDAKATARAWCRTAYSAAEATGSGTAAFFASASASGSGRTWQEAKAAASSSSANKLRLEVGTETDIKIKVRTEAEGKATADASAKVTCSDAPPPPHDECPDIPGDQPEGYECNPPVIYEKPLAEIWAGEHATDENGTTTVWGRIKCDARLTCLLNRPTDNSDLGEMVSWMQGSVEDGWLRFSGTWRNASTLPPGEHLVELTAIGTDSRGQEVTTKTTLKVVKIVHPET